MTGASSSSSLVVIAGQAVQCSAPGTAEIVQTGQSQSHSGYYSALTSHYQALLDYAISNKEIFLIKQQFQEEAMLCLIIGLSFPRLKTKVCLRSTLPRFYKVWKESYERYILRSKMIYEI